MSERSLLCALTQRQAHQGLTIVSTMLGGRAASEGAKPYPATGARDGAPTNSLHRKEDHNAPLCS
eukprot:11273844-Prorocentrum_lima.AAC.1